MGSKRIHYRFEGKDGAPVLVLSNALGTTLEMWQPQMPALLERYKVLRYDARGHGASWVTPAPYSIAQLGQDVIALLDELGVAQARFCGLSLGGMAGIWLGVHHPARFSHLALCNTTAKLGTAEIWNARIEQVLREGMAAVVPGIIDRWFTKGFQERQPQHVEVIRQMLLRADRIGYTGGCAAVRDMDMREELAAIRVPTLVVAGTHDAAMPPQDLKLMAGCIPGARYAELDAAHLSNWEQSAGFTRHLLDFLQE